jgi:amino-acid N-acetyltransferase
VSSATPVYEPAAELARPAIVGLLQECQLPWHDLPETLESFFVARVEDQVVGVVGLEDLGGAALLRSLAVRPSWRGRALGHRLWALARQRARDLGARELYLLTTTAEPLFARWGFQRITRAEAPPAVQATSEFRSVCPDSAALMRLAL